MSKDYRHSDDRTYQLSPILDLVRQSIHIALNHGASIDQLANIVNFEVSYHSQKIWDIEQTPGPYPVTPKLIVKDKDSHGTE